MKKKIIILFLCGIIVIGLTGCSISKKENKKEEKFMIGNTLEDGRVIHFSFDVPYIIDKKKSFVSEAFTNHSLTLDQFIEKLDYVDGLWDGGSKLYKYDTLKEIYGKEEFYVLVCNSFENTKDIYVAKKKDTLSNLCNIKVDDLEDVNMMIKDGTLTRKGATIIITDKSNRENVYGDSYRIDRLENGVWVELKTIIENYAWNSIGYSVDKNNELEMKINWEWLYGSLEDGKYRLVKDTSYAGEGTKHYITVEFNIDNK